MRMYFCFVLWQQPPLERCVWLMPECI
jgi:hypothetical protein